MERNKTHFPGQRHSKPKAICRPPPGHGKDVAGADPISFEEWIKIQAHITAALAQGIDPNALLAQYKMNAADWGTAGGYWSMKMGSNPAQYLEQYQVLSAKYAAWVRSRRAW